MGSSSTDNLRVFLRDIREVLEAPSTVSDDELARLARVCDSLLARFPTAEDAYLEMRSAVPKSDQECPFRGLPVAHLSLRSCRQKGNLQRAERKGFLDAALSIRCTGRFFGGFLDGWLLLYGSPTGDLRPRTTIRVAKAWDCATGEEFRWPERVFGVEDLSGACSFFQAPSTEEKSSWLLALSGNAQEEEASAVPSASEEDGIYVEPDEVSGPTREELNRSFNYDTPRTPPRRVENEQFRHKYEDIKSKIASQLLLTPPSASRTPPAPAQPPAAQSSGIWWFRRRRKDSQASKKPPTNDPTYEVIETK
ncbi:uncharacterized protein LOC132264233 [Phlebotomus argentipes]|uniref:uncharacterized protein LOC132264233 n=1 Tax=Phlebotomus argentipes TaxID=94469 RepID=UPI0028934EB6|nr:uncharacterized protein LOC132264233 [Phlebotomus argentipes]